MQFKDVPALRIRRSLLLYNVYGDGDNALLVLKGTSLNSVNDLLSLSYCLERNSPRLNST